MNFYFNLQCYDAIPKKQNWIMYPMQQSNTYKFANSPLLAFQKDLSGPTIAFVHISLKKKLECSHPQTIQLAMVQSPRRQPGSGQCLPASIRQGSSAAERRRRRKMTSCFTFGASDRISLGGQIWPWRGPSLPPSEVWWLQLALY